MLPPRRPQTQILTRALGRFLATEVGGGVVVLMGVVIALGWANSPWQASYRSFWTTPLAIGLGQQTLALDLRHWVNEGGMAIFFLVVGLEVKRELVEGELRDRRKAALPVIAAAGGMVVPALFYAAVNAGRSGARGWGIPMATDIALALGVAALLGRRVSTQVKLFLLALAVADDIGAIIVIALFYSGGIDGPALAMAALILLTVIAARRLRVRPTTVYVVLGIGLWIALHQSGLHATLAGVAMGLLAPTRPHGDHDLTQEEYERELMDVSSPRAARTTARLARRAVSEVEWLEHVLHPWTSYLIVPLFALANAGIALGGQDVRAAAGSTVTLGVMAGLVLGKPLGITTFSWLACRLGAATLPADVRWREIAGAGAMAGIGFTVSLFLAELAFPGSALGDEAKVGIAAASVLASALGALIFMTDRHPPEARPEARPD